MKVLAISGWKRSGKDTAANYLVEKHGYKRVAFADVLKDMVAEEYNIPREYCDLPEYKEAALKQYPVEPKDDFSKSIANIMFGEFRTVDNKKSIYSNFKASEENKEKLYWTPRALCILKGSVNRSVSSNYWVSRAIKRMEQLTSVSGGFEKAKFVISDLRYKSEVEQLKSKIWTGVTTIRVNRFDSSESTDPSEIDLNDFNFDVIVENKDSLEEFLKKVDNIA